jgi:hypothetical protein
MTIAIVRNEKGVEYFCDQPVIYLCLTLEAYHFAKKTNNKVLYPYKFNKLHDVNYYNTAKKLSLEHLDFFYKDLQFEKSEKIYLISRIITFFAMTIFDINLSKEIISKYKHNNILCFKEDKINIINGRRDPNTGFYYFIEIFKVFCKNNGNKLDFYIDRIPDKGYLREKINILNFFKKSKFYFPYLVDNFILFFKNYKKNLVFISGIRGADKDLINNLSSGNVEVSSNTGTIFFKILSKVLLLLNNNRWKKPFNNKNQKINSQYLNDFSSFIYKNKSIFNFEFNNISKFIKLYCLERDIYSYFFKKKKPVAVISQDNYVQLIAANLLNIKTFHISHGIVVTPEIAPMLGTYNYMSNKIQCEYHFSNDMVLNNQVKIPPAHLSTEGAPKIKILKSKDHMIILLAKNMGMRRWEFDDYKEHFLLCESVVNATKKFGCKLLIKIHPSGGRHMIDIYKSLSIFKSPRVSIDISDNYIDILSNSSVVVAMQESSAIFQAICKKRLVIFPTSHYSKPYKDNVMINYISSNTISPKNVISLNQSLRFILGKNKNYYTMIEKQRKAFGTNIICASKAEISKKISNHILKHI